MSDLATLCTEALKWREEKEERYYEEVRSKNFVTPLLNIKDKVPVDVATLLVVNHVNLGVLCFFVLCLCLYLCHSYRSKIKYIKRIRVQ